jgi:SagB-type dehydrogenase family enzyme
MIPTMKDERQKNPPELLERLRYFLKDHIRQEIDFRSTEQARGVPPPPVQKPYPPDARQVQLTKVGEWKGIKPVAVERAIGNRKSRRDFSGMPLTFDHLSFLLWATQGIRQRLNAGTALRTVPSAGARHAFETYVCVLDVEGVEPGIYRYLPVEHRLLQCAKTEGLGEKLVDGTLGQGFAGRAAATFAWTVITRRMEWRYGLAAHKVIALDAGHVCQNLYLACEAIGAGTCAIAAYDQKAMDRLLDVDGREEFTVYLAPVGMLDG